MIGVQIHIFVVAVEHNPHIALTGRQIHNHRVRQAPVVPVGHPAVRHHHRTRLVAVERQRTHRALVLRVHRPVAIGVTQHHSVAPRRFHLHRHHNLARGVVNFAEALAVIPCEAYIWPVAHFSALHDQTLIRQLKRRHRAVIARF